MITTYKSGPESALKFAFHDGVIAALRRKSAFHLVMRHCTRLTN
jgi:hypothetical protein